MLVHPGKGKGSPVVFDYRETAPAAVSPTMYTQEESQFTHRAVATPGTVRGLAMAHARLGDKDRARQWYGRAVAWTEKNREVSAGLTELIVFIRTKADFIKEQRKKNGIDGK